MHGEDIRRPLAIGSAYPLAGVIDALGYQLRTRTAFGGGRERAEGLRLVAVERGDAWGEGQEVTGAAIDLLLAVSGRPVDPGLLPGPGTDRLTTGS